MFRTYECCVLVNTEDLLRVLHLCTAQVSPGPRLGNVTRVESFGGKHRIVLTRRFHSLKRKQGTAV